MGANATSATRRFHTAAATAGPARNPSAHAYLYHGQSYAPFHVARYDWPHGYRYRAYAVGTALPRVFWVHQYFVTNYADYGMEAPDPGFQWIRYGPDLLLVDLASGQVANVVPGIFDDGAPAPQDVAEQPQ